MQSTSVYNLKWSIYVIPGIQSCSSPQELYSSLFVCSLSSPQESHIQQSLRHVALGERRPGREPTHRLRRSRKEPPGASLLEDHQSPQMVQEEVQFVVLSTQSRFNSKRCYHLYRGGCLHFRFSCHQENLFGTALHTRYRPSASPLLRPRYTNP